MDCSFESRKDFGSDEGRCCTFGAADLHNLLESLYRLIYTIHVVLLRWRRWRGRVTLISVRILVWIRVTSVRISSIWVSSIRIPSILISIGISSIALIAIGIGRWWLGLLLWSTLYSNYGLSINLKALKSSPLSTIPSELSSIDLMA